MPPLPVVSGDEARRAFESVGWVMQRQTGSHMILKRAGRVNALSIPRHRTLKAGTLRSLIRKAGMTVDEFTACL